MVKGKMKVKMKKITKKKRIVVDKYNTAKLNNRNTRERFKYQMAENIKRINTDIMIQLMQNGSKLKML